MNQYTGYNLAIKNQLIEYFMSISGLPFFIPVRYPEDKKTFWHKLEENVDEYLSLGDEIAEVKTLDPNNSIQYVTIEKKEKSNIGTALKVASYVFTLFLAPLIALGIKNTFRVAHKFSIIAPSPPLNPSSQPPETLQPGSPLHSPKPNPSPQPSQLELPPQPSLFSQPDLPLLPSQPNQPFQFLTFIKEYVKNSRSNRSAPKNLPNLHLLITETSPDVSKILNSKKSITEKIQNLRNLREEKFTIYLQCTFKIIGLLTMNLKEKKIEEISQEDLSALYTEGHILGIYISKIDNTYINKESIFNYFSKNLSRAIFKLNIPIDRELVFYAFSTVFLGTFDTYQGENAPIPKDQLIEHAQKNFDIELKNDALKEIIENQLRSVHNLEKDFNSTDKDLYEKIDQLQEKNDELIYLFYLLFNDSFQKTYEAWNTHYNAYAFAAGNSVENAIDSVCGMPDNILSTVHSVFYTLVSPPASEQQVNSGWKIHINTPESHLNQITRIIAPYLIANQISSKIVRSHKRYQYLCEGENNSQRGKFITIYSDLKIY